MYNCSPCQTIVGVSKMKTQQSLSIVQIEDFVYLCYYTGNSVVITTDKLEIHQTLTIHKENILAVDFSTTSGDIVSVSNNELIFYGPTERKDLTFSQTRFIQSNLPLFWKKLMKTKTDWEMCCVSWSPMERVLLVCGEKITLWRYQAQKVEKFHSISSPTKITHCEISDDGRLFVTSSSIDSLFKMWYYNPDTEEFDFLYLRTPSPLCSLSWRKIQPKKEESQQVLLTVDEDGIIRVWTETNFQEHFNFFISGVIYRSENIQVEWLNKTLPKIIDHSEITGITRQAIKEKRKFKQLTEKYEKTENIDFNDDFDSDLTISSNEEYEIEIDQDKSEFANEDEDENGNGNDNNLKLLESNNNNDFSNYEYDSGSEMKLHSSSSMEYFQINKNQLFLLKGNKHKLKISQEFFRKKNVEDLKNKSIDLVMGLKGNGTLKCWILSNLSNVKRQTPIIKEWMKYKKIFQKEMSLKGKMQIFYPSQLLSNYNYLEDIWKSQKVKLPKSFLFYTRVARNNYSNIKYWNLNLQQNDDDIHLTNNNTQSNKKEKSRNKKVKKKEKQLNYSQLSLISSVNGHSKKIIKIIKNPKLNLILTLGDCNKLILWENEWIELDDKSSQIKYIDSLDSTTNMQILDICWLPSKIPIFFISTKNGIYMYLINYKNENKNKGNNNENNKNNNNKNKKKKKTKKNKNNRNNIDRDNKNQNKLMNMTFECLGKIIPKNELINKNFLFMKSFQLINNFFLFFFNGNGKIKDQGQEKKQEQEQEQERKKEQEQEQEKGGKLITKLIKLDLNEKKNIKL
ncbi:rabconnectin-related [Anaeramoeba flamelloides]|uniref:Rabconnectin-related n=1 Tax=Anaeramoeba flamelloides TaxID=1746091 RepID=A0AAV7YEW9_9EUKA|nr:rabconnectin-related [Anaeramoeba flamelloides]